MTRARIRASAAELFSAHGYASTSINAIARHAGVAVQTVYFTFGSKMVLLKEMLDVAVAGDEDPVATLDRAWVAEAIAEPDPAEQLRLQTGTAREILERAAPVLGALRGAATADPEAAELWATNRAQHREVQHHLIEHLAAKAELRDGMSVRTATDIALTIGGIETYQLLVHDCGWSPQQWEHWAADVLVERLLNSS